MTRFGDLHHHGLFVMPNPWDIGSAKILEALGFPALATTSSGHAASLGRADQQVTLDELIEHAAAIVSAVEVPVNVDAEHLFSPDVAGIGPVVRRIASTGAAGFSIEDYDPATGTIDPMEVAAERVAAAADAARPEGMVLTARAENLLYRAGDLDDTIARLLAYRDAGADIVYAPGLLDIDDITTVVREVAVPLNVLALPGTPSIAELAAAGVRRVSTGGALARAAYAELKRRATELSAAVNAART